MEGAEEGVEGVEGVEEGVEGAEEGVGVLRRVWRVCKVWMRKL